MRVAIVSRIFNPEPSAASFRLGALAEKLAERGHEAVVFTVKPPKSLRGKTDDRRQTYRVKRFPVLRDRAGYVRGYVQYLSFDVPLFFRVLFGRKVHAIVAEPPPTTGFFVRLAAAIRRTPYVYYAADIWADGASQTGAPGWIIRTVRMVERFAMRGAKTVLSVSDDLTDRLAELSIVHNVLTVGNGVDTKPFYSGMETGEHYRRVSPREFVYAGTASEWHGSTVFVEALPTVLAGFPDTRIRFIGGGSEFEQIKSLAAELRVSDAVTLEPFLPPAELAPILRGAVAALASIRPGLGNEFTFPTKLYASTLCGAPAIFAGVGPAVEFLNTELESAPLGLSVPIDPSAVADAMLQMLRQGDEVEHRMRVVAWGLEHVSLSAVADRIVTELERIARA